jgi:murein DD-endopeptidase MepM/ murein hydrolase activator NlpD
MLQGFEQIFLEDGMSRLTRYNRKIKMTVVKAMSMTCLFCLFYIPIKESKSVGDSVGYYTVILNGQELGAVNSEEEAAQALAAARKRISSDNDEIVLMNPDFSVVEETRLFATRMSEKDIEDAIYENLASSVVNLDTTEAYTVRIDDFTVTVGSKDDVIKLMESVKKNYDSNNEFQVDLVATGKNDDEYSVNMVKSGIGSNASNIVAAALNGELTADGSVDAGTAASGLTGIDFQQEVTVTKTSASSSQVMSLEDAVEAVTKEKAEKTIYEVEVGDCLSTIASANGLKLSELFELNEGMTEDMTIMPGDQVIITVPTPELSVVTTERATYEETYNADVQYVDNEDMYRGTSNVIQEGTDGYRRVTADITYTDGKESDRTILAETIIEESQPKIIEVGTQTPPTYIKPIYGGTFSSGFEYRWGSFHSGIDWACSQGTSVMATADGVVTRAGWYSGYGYCVDIQHANGVTSRYGHLSSIKVSVGQTVSQYEVVALSGNTGNSTGPHVHFEIHINGTAVNPLNYVNKY